MKAQTLIISKVINTADNTVTCSDVRMLIFQTLIITVFHIDDNSRKDVDFVWKDSDLHACESKMNIDI